MFEVGGQEREEERQMVELRRLGNSSKERLWISDLRGVSPLLLKESWSGSPSVHITALVMPILKGVK